LLPAARSRPDARATRWRRDPSFGRALGLAALAVTGSAAASPPDPHTSEPVQRPAASPPSPEHAPPPPAATEAEPEPAPPAAEACERHHEEGQRLQRAGELIDAAHELRRCLHPACAPLLRSDCGQWLEQVTRALPTIVFGVETTEGDLVDVSVYHGDERLVDRLDGTPVEVDPGVYVLRFVRAGATLAERRVVVRMGDRNRLIKVRLPSPERRDASHPERAAPSPPAPTPPAPSPLGDPGASSPPDLLTYSLYGAAGLAAIAGTIFAIDGYRDLQDGEAACSPLCDDRRSDDIREKFLIADGLFVLAGLTATWATIRVLSAPSESVKKVELSVTPLSISARGRF